MIILVLVLAGLTWGGMRLWLRVESMAMPVLVPLNQAYAGISTVPERAMGLHIEPLDFKGWDGGHVPAVIVSKAGEESSRQLSVLGEMASWHPEHLGYIDYVLICVDWDHGIRSALPLAESLTAAGLRCVLWEPRGADSRRPYCTHGLQESKDVPLLIDALLERYPKENPVIVGLGRKFGAGLLLQAAAKEPRIRGLISIDSFASLRNSLSREMPRSWVSIAMISLMDLVMSGHAGYESFDVAPVESATRLDRNVPVLLLNLEQGSTVADATDALRIYNCLQSDVRSVWSVCDVASILKQAKEQGSPNRASLASDDVPEDMGRLADEDAAIMTMLRWLNEDFVTALETPQVHQPARPVLTSGINL